MNFSSRRSLRTVAVLLALSAGVLFADARPGEEISPAQVQFLIARDEARDQGRTITAQTTDDEMRLSF